jgi:hypothetical protein
MKFSKEEFRTLKDDISTQGNLDIRVVSDSMVPIMMINESFIVDNIGDLEELKKFDIVIFLLDEKLMAHFFWGKNFMNTEFMFKSLKEINSFDLPIPRENILGRVRLEFPLKFKLKVFASLILKRRK